MYAATAPYMLTAEGRHVILSQTVLPQAVAAKDRWLASMALWLLGERDAARDALLTELSSLLHPDELEGMGPPRCEGPLPGIAGAHARLSHSF
jgi:hypothetical protein